MRSMNSQGSLPRTCNSAATGLSTRRARIGHKVATYKAPGATHQAQQAVGIKHKVGVVRGVVPDDGVHAADLEVGGDDLHRARERGQQNS